MKFNRFGNMMPPEASKKHPYLLWREPFQIAGNLYFVGNLWCSSHLINTGDGLILLDTPYASALPGLVGGICKGRPDENDLNSACHFFDGLS